MFCRFIYELAHMKVVFINLSHRRMAKASRSLDRASAVRSDNVWNLRKHQTKSLMSGPSFSGCACGFEGFQSV